MDSAQHLNCDSLAGIYFWLPLTTALYRTMIFGKWSSPFSDSVSKSRVTPKRPSKCTLGAINYYWCFCFCFTVCSCVLFKQRWHCLHLLNWPWSRLHSCCVCVWWQIKKDATWTEHCSLCSHAHSSIESTIGSGHKFAEQKIVCCTDFWYYDSIISQENANAKYVFQLTRRLISRRVMTPGSGGGGNGSGQQVWTLCKHSNGLCSLNLADLSFFPFSVPL